MKTEKNITPDVISASSIKKPKSDIQYANSGNPFLISHGGNTDINRIVLDQVKECIPELVSNERNTLRQICGEEFWRQLRKGERIIAGKFIAYVVSKNGLPLVAGLKTSSNDKTYYLK